jgi:serine/threonine-protein kinase
MTDATKTKNEVDSGREVSGRAPAARVFISKSPPREEDLIGRCYGRFRLVERIGEGGMGVVYRGDRCDGVQQSVAIKLVSNVALASRARFEREAQLLARLEHPAVARLIDAGVEDERAWIAMEFVRGKRIDQYCAERHLAPNAIVALMMELTGAVSAAHRLLVVHSDIKPANVLVTAEGMPKLIDFGISTVLRDAGADPAVTVGAGRLFSPGFAAPEQISGGAVTVATDVYGLGALAYRLLTGRITFPDAVDPVAYMRAATQRDVRPASRAALASGQATSEARKLEGDLDAVLAKALEREPARRYASVEDMRADFERYLTRRPVLARAPSLVYRAGKFVERNALAVGLASLLLISLMVGGALMMLQGHREAVARNMAAQRGQFLESLLKSADPRRGRRDISVAELLDAASAELDRKLADEPLVEASMLGLIAQTYNGLGRYSQGLMANDRELAILHAHGGSSLELGQALSMRGELLREEGKWNEAVPVMRDAVALLRPTHATADLCGALYLLGLVQAHTNHVDEAEATHREVLAMESRGNQELRRQRMFPYHALAVELADLGRYAEAETNARAAVEVAREWLPPEHPDLLALETTYANAMLNSGGAAQAEPLVRQVIETETRVLGPNHKDTLLARMILTEVLLGLGRSAEALTVAQPTAQQLESLLGADNIYTLQSQQDYGHALCEEHEEEAGLDILHRVDAARRRTLPPGDRYIYATTLGIGLCLLREQRYPAAEIALLDAAAGLESARGPRYLRTQEAYRALKDLYLATGKPDVAARWAGKILT